MFIALISFWVEFLSRTMYKSVGMKWEWRRIHTKRYEFLVEENKRRWKQRRKQWKMRIFHAQNAYGKKSVKWGKHQSTWAWQLAKSCISTVPWFVRGKQREKKNAKREGAMRKEERDSSYEEQINIRDDHATQFRFSPLILSSSTLALFFTRKTKLVDFTGNLY